LSAEVETYKSEEEYQAKLQTKAELASKWANRIQSADRVYKAWADRFMVSKLYQYYEGFQFEDMGIDPRPYVVNMIYSNIETKLPALIFSNPQFVLRPRPQGLEYDMERASHDCQIREDAINYICGIPEFGLNDKHELAILDAFFGFGVLEVDHSKDSSINPMLGKKDNDPLDRIYCKHIPFDQFRVSSLANWDLSMGKWCGYYEFVTFDELAKFNKNKVTLNIPAQLDEAADASTMMENTSGKIVIGEESNNILIPNGTALVWRIWDFNTEKYIRFIPGCAEGGNRLLAYEDFDYCPLSILRFGKRRKGWYPLPPVFNWISPQDEINEIRNVQRIHRKRYSRKYTILESSVDEDEEQKFLFGPDGTVIHIKKEGAIQEVRNEPLDSSNQQSLIVSYDDMNRVSGTSSEARGLSDRTTATQAGIMDVRSKIREVKDSVRVGNFLSQFARNLLRALRKTNSNFWILSKLDNEGLLGEVKQVTKGWKTVPSIMFDAEDYHIETNVTSISPIYAAEDADKFMKFLALITQYEILAFSPALIREAAYRMGYKNEAVLKQFQELSMLASIGRLQQAKAAAGQLPQGQIPQGPQPTAPGQMAQNQVDNMTPPDMQQITNMIFNRQPVQ
jgi:hypothetical protein